MLQEYRMIGSIKHLNRLETAHPAHLTIAKMLE